MKPYASYKPSGVPWLGDVPGQWEVSYLRHVLVMHYGDALAADVRVDGDVPVYGSNGIVGTHNASNTDAPAIIVGRKGSYGKLNFSESAAFCIDTAYHIGASDCDGCSLRFIYYALMPLGLDTTSQDTGVPGLSREVAYRTKISVPPPDEQQAIADYLDVETARIDTLIHEKDELIGLLREARTSVIDRAVQPHQTRAAPLKRYVKGIATGPFGSALHADDYVSGGAFLINPTHIVHGKLAPDADVSLSDEAATALGVYRFKAGDIVVGRRGEMGRCAVVPDDGEAYYCGTGCLMLFPDTSKVVPSYLAMVISSTPSKDWLSLESVGSTMENLNSEILARLPCFIPSIDEQIRLLEQVHAEIVAYDNLLTYVQEEITLLKELRAATIADAVLGRVDVRTKT